MTTATKYLLFTPFESKTAPCKSCGHTEHKEDPFEYSACKRRDTPKALKDGWLIDGYGKNVRMYGKPIGAIHYKMCGNGVVANVVEAVVNELIIKSL